MTMLPAGFDDLRVCGVKICPNGSNTLALQQDITDWKIADAVVHGQHPAAFDEDPVHEDAEMKCSVQFNGGRRLEVEANAIVAPRPASGRDGRRWPTQRKRRAVPAALPNRETPATFEQEEL